MELLTSFPTRRIARKIVDAGIAGIGPLDSADELAERYAKKCALDSTVNPVDAARHLIERQSRLGFAGGFITGLGGLATMPISMPAGIAINWMVQARQNAAIAALFGHDISTPAVQQKILETLLEPDEGDLLADGTDDVEYKFGIRTLKQLPGQALNTLGSYFRKRLVKSGIKRGAQAVGPRFLPVIGGFISGRVDNKSCTESGIRALAAFGPQQGNAIQ